MESEPDSPSSLKSKLKSSLCLSCCFRKIHNQYHRHHHHQHEGENFESPDSMASSGKPPKLTRCSSARTKQRFHDVPELKHKCRNFISRFGGGGGGRHPRRHSADFHYDALSYSLNFDEGCDGNHQDEFPLRDFSSRLPASPPSSTASREITAFT